MEIPSTEAQGNVLQRRVNRLLEYAGEDRDILDPWYTDDFDTTYNDVVKGCKALLEFIKKYDFNM